MVLRKEIGASVLDSVLTGCARAQNAMQGFDMYGSAGAVASTVAAALQDVFEHAVSPLCAL